MGMYSETVQYVQYVTVYSVQQSTVRTVTGKVVEDNAPPKVQAPAKDKKKQNKTPDVVKKGQLECRVAFSVDDLKICVSDLAKHYKVQTCAIQLTYDTDRTYT